MFGRFRNAKQASAADPQLFLSSPKLSHPDHCFQKWIETEKMLSISFRKHCEKKERKLVSLFLLTIKKFSLLIPLLHQQLVLFLCFY